MRGGIGAVIWAFNSGQCGLCHARDTGADERTLLLRKAHTMANQLLMPKATAVWLIDNTALTFDQIAKFCTLHPLEVKAMADDEGAQSVKGVDPIATGQLTREEISKGEADSSYDLHLSDPKVRVPQAKKKSPRYTPVSKRQDRPNAILWLVRNHPELKDAQISRLVGTTKNTIDQIRNRTHWNSANLQPIDPVALGLCSQIDLDFEVQKAAKNKPAEQPVETGDTLLPAAQTENMQVFADGDEHKPAATTEEDEIDADAVFAKLNALKKDSDDKES